MTSKTEINKRFSTAHNKQRPTFWTNVPTCFKGAQTLQQKMIQKGSVDHWQWGSLYILEAAHQLLLGTHLRTQWNSPLQFELWQIDKYRLQTTQVRINYIRLHSTAPTSLHTATSSRIKPEHLQRGNNKLHHNPLKGDKTPPTKLTAQNYGTKENVFSYLCWECPWWAWK